MRVLGNQPVVRFRNINEVIGEVRAILRNKTRRVEDDSELLRVIESMGISAEDIADTTRLLEKLERLKATTEEDVLNEKIVESAITPEEDLENARVPTAKIKELVE